VSADAEDAHARMSLYLTEQPRCCYLCTRHWRRVATITRRASRLLVADVSSLVSVSRSTQRQRTKERETDRQTDNEESETRC